MTNVIRKLAVFGCLTVLVPAGAQEPGPVFRTTAREVVLDLVVRDRKARQVKDLQSSEVQIFEDGVPQQVLGFRFVAGRSAGAGNSQPRPSNALRAVNLICLVFENILGDPDLLTNALEASRQFLAVPLQPGSYVGVFRLDAGLVTLHPFTDDREELLQAARAGFAAPAEDFAGTAAAMRSSIPGAPEDPQPVARKKIARGGIGAMSGFVFRDWRPGLDQMTTVVRQLEGLPGRKTVVVFGRGLLNPPERQLQLLVEQAKQAHITFYDFPLAGQHFGGTAATDPTRSTWQTGDPERAMRQPIGGSGVRVSPLATSTGGDIFATLDYKKAFQRVFEDVNTHYEATYRPRSEKLDGHLRRVEVRVSRPGLTVQSRTGYFAVPDTGAAPSQASFETAAFAALAAQQPPHAFDFQSRAYRFRPGETATDSVIAFEFPGSSLSATSVPERQKYKVHYSLLALVKDPGGQVVAKLSRDFPAEIDEAQWTALRGGVVVYAAPIQIVHGRHTVETAVVDHEGARATAGAFELASLACRGVCLSDPVLVQGFESLAAQPDPADPLQIPRGRVVPELAASLRPDVSPRVYFVVYPNRSSADKPRISMKVLVNGQVTTDQMVDLPAPDTSGAIPMVIRLNPHSGKSEIRIAALQGRESVERTLTYSVPGR